MGSPVTKSYPFYSLRAVADALSLRITTLRNDVARGTLFPDRCIEGMGNMISHKEALAYREYRKCLKPNGEVPTALTYKRLLKRAFEDHMIVLHGMQKAARLLDINPNTLSHSNNYYVRTHKPKLWRLNKPDRLNPRTDAANGSTNG